MLRPEKADNKPVNQRDQVVKMSSLKTKALQKIAEEIQHIYSDQSEGDRYEEPKEWSTEKIFDDGDVRPFFDSIAKLSTVSAARIMLIYLMRVNGINVNTIHSEEAIRFVENSDEKKIKEYLNSLNDIEAEAGPVPKNVLHAVSERTRKECMSQGFKFSGSGYRSWNRLFAALLKNPDMSLLTVPAFTYHMPSTVCELFMQKAMRRDYFNLYDREELLIWIVLEYSDLTDSYFDNYYKLCKLYSESPVNSEKDKAINKSAEGVKLVDKPAMISEATKDVSTDLMNDIYYSIINSMPDVSDVFLSVNDGLEKVMNWAVQRSTEKKLSENHRIRRTNEKKFREMVETVIDGFTEYEEYVGKRREEKEQKDEQKKEKQKKHRIRIQYVLKSDEDSITIPAKTIMITDSSVKQKVSVTDSSIEGKASASARTLKGRVSVTKEVILRKTPEKQIEVIVRAVTKRSEVSAETCSRIKEFVPKGSHFEILGTEYQGYIYSVLPKSSVRYLDNGKTTSKGTLSVTCSSDTYIPAGMKFVFRDGQDSFQYVVLECRNLIETKIPMELVSIDKDSNAASSGKSEGTGKRNMKTRLTMRVCETDDNIKNAEGVISANSGKDGSLPLKKTGSRGYMIAYCKCNCVVPEGTEFYLVHGDYKYIYKTTETVTVGVVQEAEIEVEWTNAEDLLKEQILKAHEKMKGKYNANGITLIPDRSEFQFLEAKPEGIVRAYTPKPMRFGKETKVENSTRANANYYSVFEQFCGDVADKDYKGVTSYGKDFLLNTREFRESRIKGSNRYSFGTDTTRKRNQLLTLAFLENCMRVKEYSKKYREKKNTTEAVGRFRDKADDMLKECGMYDIYEGNALDTFFLLLAASDSPGELYSAIWRKDHPLTEYLTVRLKKAGERHCRILRYDEHENTEIWAEWVVKTESESRELFASVPRMLHSGKNRYVLELATADGVKSSYDIKLNETREYQFEEM